MKKSLIIGIIVVIFVICIAFVIGVAFTNYNKERTSITSEEFKQIMEKKEFFMIDATSQNEYIKKVYNAVESDNRYQIEFYEYTDSDIANKFYKNMYYKLESDKGNANLRTNINLKNYSKYTLTAKGRYTILSRINNTIMYVSVSDEYKDDVKGIIEELGY